MRMYPTSDARRADELAAVVLEVTGWAHHFHADGPQMATWVLAEMWQRGTADADTVAPAAFGAAMAMATDAMRGVRAALYACDFGGFWVQLRRGHELLTLAIAVAIDPLVAEDWLSGKEVSQTKLRKAIERVAPSISEGLRAEYAHLSNEAHGRVQALSAYADESERFSWPVEAVDVNRHHVWSAHVTYCDFMYAHLGVLHWMGRGWDFLQPEIREATEAFYDKLTEYVAQVKDSGEWWMFPSAESRDWLLDAFGRSWEDREIADAQQSIGESPPDTDLPD